MKTALTIAGFDPSGWAGLQADLRAFADNRVRGFSAVSAVTAQDGLRVASVRPVSAAALTEQVEVLLGRHSPDAVKIGMLGTAANAKAVSSIIRGRVLTNVVLDPVHASTGGVPLLRGKNAAGAIRGMLPLVTVVTPNTIEAGLIAGMEVRGVRGMEEAARRIYALGAENVLATGGHLKGAPVDILYDGRRFVRFTGTRLRGPREAFHGTGCVLSAAIAAHLARGLGTEAAVRKAKAYLEKVLEGRIATLKEGGS